jgi:cytochrome c oxidase assembly factor CtaG
MVVAADAVRWQAILGSWQTDGVAIAGLTLEVVLAAAYLVAATRVSRRRRAWPWGSTVAFLAGLLVLVVALQSGLASYDDDVPWVHNLQHVLVMSVAPPLLALGAPVTLCLQALPTRDARRLVAVLHHHAVRGLCGRAAAVHLPLDYYGIMAVYLFTPAFALSRDNAAFHVGTHVVFLVCGLLFWVPIVGIDATGWRPAQRTRLLLVGVGIPVNAVIAAADGSWSLLIASETATLLGLALVVARHARVPVRTHSRSSRPVPAVTAATGP